MTGQHKSSSMLQSCLLCGKQYFTASLPIAGDDRFCITCAVKCCKMEMQKRIDEKKLVDELVKRQGGL